MIWCPEVRKKKQEPFGTIDEVSCRYDDSRVETPQKPWLKTKLDSLIANMESHIHFPFIVANGCCRPEIENVSSSTYDWSRLGVQKNANEPEQADLLIVAGWINESVASEIKDIYKNLIGRRSVIAVGACALSGGPYTVSGNKPILVSDILPVDVYVPGCPPRPEAIIEAIRLLKNKMQPRPNQTSVLYSALKDNSGQL